MAKRVSVCLSFDFDAISVWVGPRGTKAAPLIARGEFGEVGAHRIVDLLEEHVAGRDHPCHRACRESRRLRFGQPVELEGVQESIHRRDVREEPGQDGESQQGRGLVPVSQAPGMSLTAAENGDSGCGQARKSEEFAKRWRHQRHRQGRNQKH